MSTTSRWLLMLMPLLLLAGCEGAIFEGGSRPGGLPGSPGSPGSPGTPGTPGTPGGPDTPIDTPVVPPRPPVTALPGHLRRLTRPELDNTLEALLGDSTRSAALLLAPEGASLMNPFDNDFTLQAPVSLSLVESFETLITAAAKRAVADPAKKAALLPCTPTGATDSACLKQVAARFARRALRRPVTGAEVTALTTPAIAVSTMSTKFDDAVEVVIRSVLMSPEFYFRVELGVPDPSMPGTVNLTQFELATRLSYTLVGRNPPDWLLDSAEMGKLSSPADLRAAAAVLLASPAATAQVRRFHEMWLGYAGLATDNALALAMRSETEHLIDDVVFGASPDYRRLFQNTRTYVTPQLATHYGLPAPAAAGWVDYGAGSERRGVLSHGTVLSAFAQAGTISPTRRGRFVRTRLMCQPIPDPPPDVNVDAVGGLENLCLRQRLAAHATGGCVNCHKAMDPIGFGLERYDTSGRFQTAETGRPDCLLTGDGDLGAAGTFNGPGQLGDRVVESGTLDGCVVRHAFRFAVGRLETGGELGLIDDVKLAFQGAGRDFKAVLIELVAHPAFSRLVIEET